MIKASATCADGHKLVILGLSHLNLDRLRADGLKGFIKINGAELGIGDCTIMITAGETEASITQALQEFITPETKVHVSVRLKS